jgi:hypothetical protein
MLLAAAVMAPRLRSQAPTSSEPMTDERVNQLYKAGLSADELVRMIQTAQNVSFDLTPGTLDALGRGGLPENVIKAMAARTNGASASSTSPPAPPVQHDAKPAALPDDVGVYFQQGDQWVEVDPEVVNWQTGGVVKHIGTLGVVKGDVNGRLTKPSSGTHLSVPTQLLVYCTEGTAITEYQLIHLRSHSNAREFRTVTGGVFHASGGAKRDTLDFESSKIAKRTYFVKVPALEPGEYGLLSPGASMANSASAQLGKMYTFSVR